MNPFRDAIVADAWHPSASDVPSINAPALARCLEALAEVRSGERSSSVLLHGEAGSGKTHLLARLRAALEAADRPYAFVAVRLHAGANRFWRHLRRSFVDDLTRPRQGRQTQLEAVFIERLGAHWEDGAWPEPEPRHRHELQPEVQQLALEADLTLDLSRVLAHLVRHEQRLEAVAWLKGESLPEEVLDRLGVSRTAEDDEDPEAAAEAVLYGLCRFCGPAVPVVFAFDQVEALQRFPDDRAGLFAFAQAARALHDRTRNVLMVSCVQSFFLDQLQQAAGEANYAALAVHRATLNPVGADEALALAGARLEAAGLPAPARAPALAKLEAPLRAYVGASGRTARLVLGRLAELYVDGAPAPARATADDEAFLDAELAERQERALRASSADRTDEVLQGALPSLLALGDRAWREADGERPRDVDAVFERPSGERLGVSLCNQRNMTSLAARFRRLRATLAKGGLGRLVVVRDPRLPVSPRAEKTRRYLDELRRGGAAVLRPAPEALAAVEALRGLLADAQAGDLARRGSTLPEATVRAWLAARLGGPALRFAREVSGEEAGEPDGAELEDLAALLADRRVLSLEQAATELGRPQDELEELARRHAARVGLLAGPPAVVFQAVADAAADE